jgi:flagellin-specific chaperone FliS
MKQEIINLLFDEIDKNFKLAKEATENYKFDKCRGILEANESLIKTTRKINKILYIIK